jgi:hypothetical protein
VLAEHEGLTALAPLKAGCRSPDHEGMEPSAKGSIVVGVVASLRSARRRGLIHQEALAARLSASALELFEKKIEIGRWYPMVAFTELIDYEWEALGQRDPEYVRRAGILSAERQLQSGIYQQLDFAKRTGRAETREGLVRQAKLITTITSMFYNFLEVSVGIDPAHPNELQIIYANAALFTEPLRYTSEGFMNGINLIQGSQRSWTSQRSGPDRVVFRLAIPPRLGQPKA